MAILIDDGPRPLIANVGLQRHTLFSDDAVALIHQTSGGYPERSTTSPCRALVAAFAADKAIVDEKTARTAVAELTGE